MSPSLSLHGMFSIQQGLIHQTSDLTGNTLATERQLAGLMYDDCVQKGEIFLVSTKHFNMTCSKAIQSLVFPKRIPKFISPRLEER